MRRPWPRSCATGVRKWHTCTFPRCRLPDLPDPKLLHRDRPEGSTTSRSARRFQDSLPLLSHRVRAVLGNVSQSSVRIWSLCQCSFEGAKFLALRTFWGIDGCRRACEVSWASVQGLAEMVEICRDAPENDENTQEQIRPQLFSNGWPALMPRPCVETALAALAF
mmetsp:Transcript_770/g.3110  ORF Transcript_770/g.3110 Transcript_770/m.3110 type:complete len:165 (-) Transcript_770:858-1352(-)